MYGILISVFELNVYACKCNVLSRVIGGSTGFHVAAVRICYSRVKGTSWQVNTDKQDVDFLFLADITYHVNVDV